MNKLNDIPKEINDQINIVKTHIDKLLQKLPETLMETAKTYGAMVRQRVIKSPQELLLALLMYASSGISQRVLSACLAVIGMADMSDQAWQKKIIKCGPWLSFLLKETMSTLSCHSRMQLSGRTVKLLDGSILKQAGTKGKRGGESIRVHMSYNLSSGCMDDVLVTDKYTAESVTNFPITPDIIYIADAGYGKGVNLAHIVSYHGDALFRATPNHLNLAADNKGKEKIDMVKKLDTKANLIDFACHVHTRKNEYVPVRIIASRLPEDKALLAKERKIRSAKKRQTKNIRTATLVYAEWIVLMTSLGDEYSAEELLELYRSRWQIELLFKRIKQSFAVSKLPVASLNHSKVIVLLWLLLWAITEKEALAMEIFLLDKEADMTQYSLWSMHSFLFNQLKMSINCLCALFFELTEHAGCVFLRLQNHRSSRPNHYAFFHFGQGSL